jgi:Flp pilus assembly protein TadD
LNPKNELAHAALGDALGKKRDLDGAMGEYREALRINPNNDAVHVKLGDALRQKGHGDDGESESEYRKALRLNPKNERAHVMLGMEIEWRDAAPEVELAKKGQMDLDSLRRYKAQQISDLDEVIFEFGEALGLNPNDEATHFSLGVALEEKGDRRGALEEYRTAYTLDPTDAKAKQDY